MLEIILLSTCAHLAVHDGDSIRCDHRRIRLQAEAGPIDAPEVAGSPRCSDARRTTTNCDAQAGIVARDYLLTLIASGETECTQTGFDRYERMLATCTVNGRDVGGLMVAGGQAIIREDWR